MPQLSVKMLREISPSRVFCAIIAFLLRAKTLVAWFKSELAPNDAAVGAASIQMLCIEYLEHFFAELQWVLEAVARRSWVAICCSI